MTSLRHILGKNVWRKYLIKNGKYVNKVLVKLDFGCQIFWMKMDI